MNYALADRVEDIIRWDGAYDKDRWGTFHILTGYEGTGRCFWCGEELTGRATRYCRSKDPVHWRLYWEHFNWGYARKWCCRRQEGICANCGWHPPLDRDGEYSWYGLEVHHIVPLDGTLRIWTPYNLPWNLIGFCHECHLEVAAAMKPEKALTDPFEEALRTGQLVMECCRSILL